MFTEFKCVPFQKGILSIANLSRWSTMEGEAVPDETFFREAVKQFLPLAGGV
jgi:hypothetical protein